MPTEWWLVLDRLALMHGAPYHDVSTTVLHSWQTPCVIGADSPVLLLYLSIRDPRGRAPGSSRSTADCATNCSICVDSTHCWKARVITEDWGVTTTPIGHTLPMETAPQRGFALRWATTHRPRSATGPPNGSISISRPRISRLCCKAGSRVMQPLISRHQVPH